MLYDLDMCSNLQNTSVLINSSGSCTSGTCVGLVVGMKHCPVGPEDWVQQIVLYMETKLLHSTMWEWCWIEDG